MTNEKPNGIGNAGAEAIANSPHLANLTNLYLWRSGVGDAGATALADSPHLANLTRLDLGNNNIAEEGAYALAASPHLSIFARLPGLRSTGFSTLADQVERDARRYEGRE